MALKEIRIYINTPDRKLENKIAEEVCNPFTIYMDTLMRGRFKEYSGEEVKGINLVNLMLYSQEHLRDAEDRGSIDCYKFDEWIPTLNTLQLEAKLDLTDLGGNRIEKVAKVIDIFLTHARKSDLPQMKKLVVHLKESLGKQSIEGAIKQADEP